eukprot:5947331-Prymnesium_polylepis.1
MEQFARAAGIERMRNGCETDAKRIRESSFRNNAGPNVSVHLHPFRYTTPTRLVHRFETGNASLSRDDPPYIL